MTRAEAIRRINDARDVRGLPRNRGGGRRGVDELARLERKFARGQVSHDKAADAEKAARTVVLPPPAIARPKLVVADDPWSRFLRRRA